MVVNPGKYQPPPPTLDSLLNATEELLDYEKRVSSQSSVQTEYGAHRVSYIVGLKSIFLGGKAATA
jgi:hypothetical protein